MSGDLRSLNFLLIIICSMNRFPHVKVADTHQLKSNPDLDRITNKSFSLSTFWVEYTGNLRILKQVLAVGNL